MSVLGTLSVETLQLTWSVRRSLDKVSLLVTWKQQQTSNFSGKVPLRMTRRKTFAKSDKVTLDNPHTSADKEPLQSTTVKQVPKSTIKPGGKSKSPSTRKKDHARLLVWTVLKHQEKGPSTIAAPHCPQVSVTVNTTHPAEASLANIPVLTQ